MSTEVVLALIGLFGTLGGFAFTFATTARKSSLEELRELISAVQEENKRLRDRVEELEGEVGELRKENAELRAENRSLKKGSLL